jgi:cytochrome c oxidase accessory protein FixG
MNEPKQDQEGLTMLNEFGDRIAIIPAEVKGFFRRHRDWTQIVLLLIFVILPWIKVRGVQSILLDIPNRKFAIFGTTFWAHDAPLIFFILAFMTLTLTYVTSVWGRVWCGWACPQTVFIDAVYRRIERWVEGNYIERRQLEKAPNSASKIFKRSLKWFLFTLVSSIFAHSFIAYFSGADALIEMILHSPADNWTYFIIVTCVTAVILFDFAWFREQFCIIMCPYGRFQSVLMDTNSLTVVYDEKRGEPRKGKTEVGQPAGDCVSCQRCVNVCPTGIDIRKGMQMECITCTACIDACDEIMDKVKKPRGLIRYDSLSGQKINPFHPRSLLYLILILFSLIGLIYNLSTREPFMAQVLRAKDIPYRIESDGQGNEIVINHFHVHLQNQLFVRAQFTVSLPESLEQAGVQLLMPMNNFEMRGGEIQSVHFFLRMPRSFTKTDGKVTSQVLIRGKSLEGEPVDRLQEKEIQIVGPR